MAWFGRRSSLVGVDIGSSSVKVVRLRQTGKGLELDAFSLGHLASDAIVEGRVMNFALVIERLREVLKEAGIRSAPCALAISGNSVIVKRLSLPEMTRAELDEQILHILFRLDEDRRCGTRRCPFEDTE